MTAYRRCSRLAPALLVLTLGCGQAANPNAPAEVNGAVKYDGHPVTAGTVTFFAKDTGLPAGAAPIGPDGTYHVIDMPAGEMAVAIETESANHHRPQPQYGKRHRGAQGPTAEMTSPMPEDYKAAEGAYVKIPAKYADRVKSGLTVSISNGKQTKDFDLKD